MLLSVLNLFREKLPCSENFWRYKRNFELNQSSFVGNGDEESKDITSDSTSPKASNTNDGTEV